MKITLALLVLVGAAHGRPSWKLETPQGSTEFPEAAGEPCGNNEECDEGEVCETISQTVTVVGEGYKSTATLNRRLCRIVEGGRCEADKDLCGSGLECKPVRWWGTCRKEE